MHKRTLLQISIVLISSGALRAASDPVLDDLGCRIDGITMDYICVNGPLAGRVFVSRGEAQDVLNQERAQKEKSTGASEEGLPPPASTADFGQPTMAKPVEEILKVISWNMRAMAREGSDYDRAALIMADADIVALQEMNLNHRGRGFLNVIAGLIEEKSGQKICKAWVQSGSGGRERYGFLWKEKTIAFVDSEGGFRDSCGDVAQTIHQAKSMKIGAEGTFFARADKKMFVLVSVNLSHKLPRGDKSVDDLFRQVELRDWPVIVAGDLKAASLEAAHKDGYKEALAHPVHYMDNFWFRGLELGNAEALNFSERFPDARPEDLRYGLSDQPPVMAEFSLRENARQILSSSLVHKAKLAKAREKLKRQLASEKSAKKKKSFSGLKNVDENLEDEASKAEGH